MKIAVGSYKAKTKLPELLRGVQTGKRYTITLRGKAVADLVPPQGGQRSDAATAAEEMRAFMRTRQPAAGLDLQALNDEGRA
jgi:prevent-host-death family protein